MNRTRANSTQTEIDLGSEDSDQNLSESEYTSIDNDQESKASLTSNEEDTITESRENPILASLPKIEKSKTSPKLNPFLVSSFRNYSKMSKSNEDLASILTKSLSKTITSPPKIEHFHGTEGEDVNRWLDQYNFAADSQSWDDADRLRKLPQFLRDDAYDWFVTYVRDSDKKEEVDSFEKVSKLLLSDFYPIESKEFHRNELEKLTQGSRSVGTYLLKVAALCHLVDPRMSEEEKMRRMMKGMSSRIAQSVYESKPATSRDLIRKAKEIEASRALYPDDENSIASTLSRVLSDKLDGMKLRSRSESNDRRSHSPSLNELERNRERSFDRNRNRERRFHEDKSVRFSQYRAREYRPNYSFENHKERPFEQKNERKFIPFQRGRENRDEYRARERNGTKEKLFIDVNNSRSRAGNIICFSCGKTGHYARNCFSKDKMREDNFRQTRQKLESDQNPSKTPYSNNRNGVSNRMRMSRVNMALSMKSIFKTELQFLPSLNITIYGTTFCALLDTGSDACLISEAAAKKCGMRFFPYKGPDILSAMGDKLKIEGESHLDIYFDRNGYMGKTRIHFLIAKTLPVSVILGNDFHIATGLWIHPKSETVGFSPDGSDIYHLLMFNSVARSETDGIMSHLGEKNIKSNDLNIKSNVSAGKETYAEKVRNGSKEKVVRSNERHVSTAEKGTSPIPEKKLSALSSFRTPKNKLEQSNNGWILVDKRREKRMKEKTRKQRNRNEKNREKESTSDDSDFPCREMENLSLYDKMEVSESAKNNPGCKDITVKSYGKGRGTHRKNVISWKRDNYALVALATHTAAESMEQRMERKSYDNSFPLVHDSVSVIVNSDTTDESGNNCQRNEGKEEFMVEEREGAIKLDSVDKAKVVNCDPPILNSNSLVTHTAVEGYEVEGEKEKSIEACTVEEERENGLRHTCRKQFWQVCQNWIPRLTNQSEKIGEINEAKGYEMSHTKVSEHDYSDIFNPKLWKEDSESNLLKDSTEKFISLPFEKYAIKLGENLTREQHKIY